MMCSSHLGYCIATNSDFRHNLPLFTKQLLSLCIGGGTEGAVGAVAPTKYKTWGHCPHNRLQS